MKPVRNVCLIIMIALSVCCRANVAEPNKISTVEGNNKFAFSLYGKLKDTPGNLFLSPYSISTALALTYAGAKDRTEKQMADTLCFPENQQQLHRDFGALIKQLNAAGQKGSFELVVANALWGQKEYKFLPDYLSLVKTNYDGDLQQVDFVNQTEEARKTINAWVESKTKDKIKELIKQGMVDPMTRLVLTNAIYFKGKWASQFKPQQTQDAPFTLANGQKVNVPMMNQTGRFDYMETDAIQALAMPYIENGLSMVILLPKKHDGLNEMEKDLTSEKLSGWISGLRKREVQVYFPRFKLTCEFSLGETLAAMGMPDAFSAKADFSGMTGNRELFISAVVHKAFVEVNEEGTEAAAATGVGMKLTSVGQPPPVFRADHPFVFLIRDNLSGSILFLGRMMNPAS